MTPARQSDGAAAAVLRQLANGVQLLVLPLPHLATACVSVFVRAGSAHESRRLNGVSHFVEHMVFKGSTTRDARQINLDAERLGCEVDAHTDKDHTAFHLRGMAQHAGEFLRQLGDLLAAPGFPEAELERERQVLLHEHTEVDEDPMATAYRLFDRACFGNHAAAQPVIGTRRNIASLTRADLAGWVRRRYGGANVVVGVAGAVDVDAVLRDAEAAFGALAPGEPTPLTAPLWHGGFGSRRLAGSGQTHLVLGFPLPALADSDAAGDPTGEVAAALFGEGMSSPLMERIREQRGLVYYAACAADVGMAGAQFVIEASTAPQTLPEVLQETLKLLAEQAAAVAPTELERARNQIAVRWLRAHESPTRRLEESALAMFAHGRLPQPAERMARLQALQVEDLRAAYERMLSAPPALALVGRLPAGAVEQARGLLAGALARST